MAEEWLEKVARQIKERERKGAEDAARARRRVQVLRRKGPAYWKSFSEALRKNIDELKRLLEGDIILTEGPFDFAMDASTLQVSLSKAAFPSVQFIATPRFDQEAADISYQAAGTKPDSNTLTSMACGFEVKADERVAMQLDGRSFLNPQDAAIYVMEKLFRVPASRRAYSQDSHLGRVGSE